jgi:hypothetical protein
MFAGTSSRTLPASLCLAARDGAGSSPVLRGRAGGRAAPSVRVPYLGLPPVRGAPPREGPDRGAAPRAEVPRGPPLQGAPWAGRRGPPAPSPSRWTGPPGPPRRSEPADSPVLSLHPSCRAPASFRAPARGSGARRRASSDARYRDGSRASAPPRVSAGPVLRAESGPAWLPRPGLDSSEFHVWPGRPVPGLPYRAPPDPPGLPDPPDLSGRGPCCDPAAGPAEREPPARHAPGPLAPARAPPAPEPPVRGPPVQGPPVRGLPVRGLPVRGLPVRGLPVRGLPVRGLPVRGAPVRWVAESPRSVFPVPWLSRGRHPADRPGPAFCCSVRLARQSSPPWPYDRLPGGLPACGLPVAGLLAAEPPSRAMRDAPELPCRKPEPEAPSSRSGLRAPPGDPPSGRHDCLSAGEDPPPLPPAGLPRPAPPPVPRAPPPEPREAPADPRDASPGLAEPRALPRAPPAEPREPPLPALPRGAAPRPVPRPADAPPADPLRVLPATDVLQ